MSSRTSFRPTVSLTTCQRTLKRHSLPYSNANARCGDNKGGDEPIVRILVILVLLVSLVACTKPESQAPPVVAEAPNESGLERIPEPDPSKYPKIHELSEWRNPQLVVREDGIGLVDVENREIHIL